ncbi:hypothetical protein E4U21_005461 [Claviceps maximensis]|nr:hypothetical protein E4U21_005461 [Claviceps maximensis]
MAEEKDKVSTMPETTQASPGADKTTDANPTTLSQQLSSTSETPQKDTVMLDVPVEQVASSTAPANLAPGPAPARTGTPAHGSRAPSLHPDLGFAMPSEAPAHGDPTRRYLNTKVTGVLLEGMKQLAKEQ